MNVRSEFEGKKITVMGLGLLGRGVGDSEFLAKQGAELIVTDLKPAEALEPSLARLRHFSNITFTLGEHRLEDFQGRDFILKAAGVPLDSIYIEEARRSGTPIKMSASWFTELSGVKVIGVTGTRGKSTTTHMLHAIMQRAQIPVLLGGNVQGVSTLALLGQVSPEHTALFELDSWQCQGFGDEMVSPQVAVFTTFMSDHMNYYKDDMELYLRDKAQIFLHQTPEDTLVLGSQCESVVREAFSNRMRGSVVVASDATLPDEWVLGIPGVHNRYDAGLALSAARVLAIPDETSRVALESFLGVPGRLELVREVAGIRFYNDTTATTPDATIAALESFPEGKIVLIMGGADKGLDFESLAPVAKARAKKILLLAGTGTDRVWHLFPAASVFEDLQSAVTAAYAEAREGDVVLLSPACASFGMFKNEYDRGEKFNEMVKELS